MNKVAILLFLKELKGVGTVTINKEYRSIIESVDSFDLFYSFAQKNLKFSLVDLEKAKETALRKLEIIEKTHTVKALTIFDVDYPKCLHCLGDKKPPILFLSGNLDLANDLKVAVIGTRTPLEETQTLEEEFVGYLVKELKATIVSGLALGCDAIAHKTALKNSGKTIAVLPCGFNHISPKAGQHLAADILHNNGLLMTEYWLDDMATKYTFVERDTLIAAMSDGVFAMECGENSGTMHTVNAAKKLGIPTACYMGDFEKKEYAGNRKMFFEFKSLGIRKPADIELLLNGNSKDVQCSLFD